MLLSLLHNQIVKRFNSSNIESSNLDAKIILKEALNVQDEELIIDSDIFLKSCEKKLLCEMVSRREKGEPISRILGLREFFSLDFKINNFVLDPRPETEHLVEESIKKINENNYTNILELGIGSGCVIISILKSCKLIYGMGVDISLEAIKTARENARINNVNNLDLIVSDWGASIDKRFDLIISNPPYLRSNQIDSLSKEVKLFDPIISLDGGIDGLTAYQNIAKNAKRFLSDNGTIITEIAFDQAKDIKKIFLNNDFLLQNKVKDYNGLDRIMVFSKKKLKK
ncbi:MAG: peptide chain release factor N(5)-glutamine methyltransferase [Pseudomonadota bacterium]|nr:peptide chain release factor N(5)-glutamine methyltransferase [Pseudomonadota bacterium]MEC9458806.1 peptide chain release factor N(5)-glutamine methyltransferase [Pseudomonadota bacterium]